MKVMISKKLFKFLNRLRNILGKKRMKHRNLRINDELEEKKEIYRCSNWTKPLFPNKPMDL